MIGKKLIIFLIISLLVGYSIPAQENIPYWNEVQAFKKQDSISFPVANQILFIGSSSFTIWKDVQNYFPEHKILNRGFGGSSLTDLIYYVDDVIIKYKPKQIIIYCGENDFAASDTVTTFMVFERFKTLFKKIREKLPDVPIAFISLKPSPSRKHLFTFFNEANLLIEAYLKRNKSTAFIDVYHFMLNPDDSFVDNIFLEDHLHMNEKGYAIWQKIIQPYLIK